MCVYVLIMNDVGCRLGGIPREVIRGQQIVMERNTFLHMVREVANQQRQNPNGNVPNQEVQTMFDRFMKQHPIVLMKLNTRWMLRHGLIT